MTVREASGIYYINLEIRRLKRELKKLEEERSFFKPVLVTGMPVEHGGEYENPSDRFLDKQMEIQEELKEEYRKLYEKRREFERFLKSVEDHEIRLILRLRCVNNLSWEEIGAELNMDRRTASRKFYAYFDQE